MMTSVAARAKILLYPPLWVAVVLTLLNVAKPLHIDDTAYYLFARQISQDPLRPYDFEIFWGQNPVQAMDLLAPPVLPYCLAPAVRVFGDNPWAWKLWLFPFCLILTTSLRAIFRRFAQGLETPLLWLTALSPAILPGINLMLDMPALALTLAALAVFFRAVDRDSMALATLAGLVGGLASQTKYTGLTSAATILLYAVLSRRVLLGLIASATVAVVFGSIEGLIALVHGRSHLLSNIASQTEGAWDKKLMIKFLFPHVGALAPVVTMLGLAGLRVSRPLVVVPGVLVLAGLCLSGQVAQMADSDPIQFRFWQLQGLLAFAVTAAVAVRLLWNVDEEDTATGWRRPRPRVSDVFLVSWFALECVSYVVLSTFPAARRVMGMIVALTVLNGCLAARVSRGSAFQGVMPWIMACGVALGGVYYYVDLCEATVQKQAVEEAARSIRGREAGARIWFAGHWGFQYYAERDGFKPVVPDRSRLETGDWLVIPDPGIAQQLILPGLDQVELTETISLGRRITCRTIDSAYYNGRYPILANREPWVHIYVYKVIRDFVPSTPVEVMPMKPK